MGDPSKQACRVLIADDDATTQLIYKTSLAAMTAENGTATTDSTSTPAFEVVLCSQGDEAVRLAEIAIEKEAPFSVAFLDIDMPPGPDGVWTAEKLRKLDPEIQLILVTALSDIEPEEIARKIPPRDKLLYVKKPLDPRELQSLAAAFTSKWRMERLVDDYQRSLEERVAQRTAELAEVNRTLELDIAERLRVEEALRRSRAGLSRAQRLAHLGSWEVNLATRELTCSDETLRIFGITDTDPFDTIDAFLGAIHAEDRSDIENWLTRYSSDDPFLDLDHRVIRPDGSERVVHELVEFLPGQAHQPSIARGAVQDITDVKRTEEQIVFQAFHDTLTELPNRRLFNDRLRVAIARARRTRKRMAVLFLDLDDFKTVNDSLGHGVGDNLLQAVARRLTRAVREEDTVARVGGDEFLVLLQDASDPAYAVRAAERLMKSLAEPFPISKHELYVGASIGITLFPDDATTAEALISNADIAMYRAKASGRNTYKLFTQAMNLMVMERMDLELSLRKALKENEFLLHYQPMIDIASGATIGVEALIRWRRDDAELIRPDAFIPLAEETGLIVPIGEWVLKTACADTVRWHQQGLNDLQVSVNLSPRQFQLSNIVSMVKNVLSESGLPPGALVLEVTEGAVMANAEEAIRTMEELHSLGVGLSMDDFGRGYSSLCHLKRFPMNTLKIDQSFVSDVSEDADDAAVVRAIIALSRSLSLTVLAEGVETREQLDFLTAHDCDQVQGFLFGTPSSADVVVKALIKAQADRSG